MINSAYESTETSCNHEEGSSASDNVPKEQEKGEGQDSQGLELKRRVGLLSGIALIVGNMIGEFNARIIYSLFNYVQMLNLRRNQIDFCIWNIPFPCNILKSNFIETDCDSIQFKSC